MKQILFAVFLLSSLTGFSQTNDEKMVLDLSGQIFKWEVEGKIDSLDKVFNDKFVVVGSTGALQTKAQYITRLKSGNFVHNSIEVQENSASVVDNTATVVGKGTFVVTAGGKKATIQLSYIEVFTRTAANQPWSVLAMHASALPGAEH